MQRADISPSMPSIIVYYCVRGDYSRTFSPFLCAIVYPFHSLSLLLFIARSNLFLRAQIKNDEIIYFFFRRFRSLSAGLRFAFRSSLWLRFMDSILMDKFYFLACASAHTQTHSHCINLRTKRTQAQRTLMRTNGQRRNRTNERQRARRKMNKIRRKDKKR